MKRLFDITFENEPKGLAFTTQLAVDEKCLDEDGNIYDEEAVSAIEKTVREMYNLIERDWYWTLTENTGVAVA